MNDDHLRFLALTASVLYWALFSTSLAETSWYAPVGAAVVGLCWVAVTMLDLDDHPRRRAR